MLDPTFPNICEPDQDEICKWIQRGDECEVLHIVNELIEEATTVECKNCKRSKYIEKVTKMIETDQTPPTPEEKKKLKILNLYCGIGGNRKLWSENFEIVAVENDAEIAATYSSLFPNDIVIVGDAHQYLLENFKQYDFIWSSPPCPSHSRANTSLSGWGIYRYPDMKLYEEIIFLKHFFKGKWVVENVKPYYVPLIEPTIELDRHLFWSNFPISSLEITRDYDVSRATKETLAEHHKISLPIATKGQRKLLRNAVYPPIGEHILNLAFNQQSL